MRLPFQPQVPPTGDPIVDKALRTLREDTARVVNGNVSFGNPTSGTDNISGAWYKAATPGVHDTEFTITHNLNRVPNGFIVVSQDQAAIVYSSRINAWTKTQAFAKCNTASVNIVLYVI